jgi:hypothetical protein
MVSSLVHQFWSDANRLSVSPHVSWSYYLGSGICVAPTLVPGVLMGATIPLAMLGSATALPAQSSFQLLLANVLGAVATVPPLIELYWFAALESRRHL